MLKISIEKGVAGPKHDFEPIAVSKVNPNEVHGGDICPVPYCNTLIVAETQSGKTSALGHILESCAGNALIVAFVPSIDSDEAWVKIRKKLRKNGNKFISFDSIEEDEVDEDDEIEEEDDDSNSKSLSEKKEKKEAC